MRPTWRWVVESVLWTVVVGSGLTLTVIAGGQLLASASLTTVASILESELTHWTVVVAFGITLLVAASKRRPSANRDR